MFCTGREPDKTLFTKHHWRMCKIGEVRWTFSDERSRKHEKVIMGVNVTIYFLID